MGVRETVNNARARWMDGDGPENDIVISSRIRLARNLTGILFPNQISQTEADSVFHAVQLAISKEDFKKQFTGMELVRMGELSPVERSILMEKHLISPDLLKDHEKKAVVLSEDEIVSIMLNEEDHLRIQCLLPGLQLQKAWETANKLDDALEATLDYAFSEHLGYLTACPTNVGTGLRASVMVHLPGLTIMNRINEVITAVSKLGLTVRGLYGEGTQAMGNLFQVSNQVTLGLTEEEIINKLTSVVKQLIDQERMARKVLYRDKKYQLEDRIYRAYGTLKYARMLTSDEAMRYISDVRLGADLDVIKNLSPKVLNELIVMTRPAYLHKQAQRELTSHERDVMRAEIVRKKLNTYN
ncbi:MAG: protein arginine kinase [Desulfotomaculum sp.]|nr:protein arginine kinase [Desulfotomaculum sp.]